MTTQQLYDDIDFLCSSTSATYPVATKLRNMNIAYQNVARLIWEAADTWQYDDSNATDFGIATTDLVASQQDYSLPSTCQRVQRVEVNGELAQPVDIHDLTLATSEENTGTIRYDLVGRSIFLYPTPTAASTAGLKVFFDRDVTDLDDVADVPGFATAFHRILSLGASIDFSRNENDIKLWVADKARLENGLKRFYSKRGIQGRTIIKPAGKKRWRNYQ